MLRSNLLRNFALVLPLLAGACGQDLDLGHSAPEQIEGGGCPPNCNGGRNGPDVGNGGAADGGQPDGAGDGGAPDGGQPDGSTSGVDGTWTKVPAPALLGGSNLWAIWGRNANDIWAVGDGPKIIHFDGTLWTSSPTNLPSTTAVALNTVWGTSTIVRAQGFNGLSLLRTSDWAKDEDLSYAAYGLWGTSDTDIWSVGGGGMIPFGKIFHYDGTRWEEQRSEYGTAYFGVWGSSSHDVWTIGYKGEIEHYDGQVWTTIVQESHDDTSPPYRAIWGSGAHDVWAVGTKILHYNGSTWDQSSFTPLTTLHAVWGVSATDVWAAGGGTIVHFDGTSWKTFGAYDPALSIFGIWGSSATDVWAVGGSGTILHFQ